VSNERLIRKLQRVETVRRDLASFLERLRTAISLGIRNLRRGVPVSSQTPDAAEVHVELVQKLDDMHHAVHEARAESVRVLVEDEGLPVSAVAQLLGRPRQLVSRLYHQARSEGDHRGNGSVRRNGSVRGNGSVRANGRPEGPSEAPPTSVDVSRSGSNPRTRIPPAAR
jgi:hypothetical protein